MRLALPLALALCCGACVSVPDAYLEGARGKAMEAPVKDLDPGYKTEETAHFKLRAYTAEGAAAHAALCEANYTRIMQDLGIYSFVPREPYNVLVYRDQAEYRAKTGMPDWSGGAAYGNALLLFEGPGLPSTMAHEMAHLLFAEYMGLSQAAQLRWLNEGIAVYEESRSSQEAAAHYSRLVREMVAPNPLPFSHLVNLAPQGDSLRSVDRWYAQAGSVVGYMIRKGGSFNFSIFLSRLRDGATPDEALRAVYTGLWRNMESLEHAWLLEVRS